MRIKELSDLLGQLSSIALINLARQIMEHQDVCILCRGVTAHGCMEVAHIYPVMFGITSDEPFTLKVCATCHRAQDMQQTTAWGPTP